MLSQMLLAVASLGFLASAALTLCLAALFTRVGFVAAFNPIVPQTRTPAALGGGLALGGGIALALYLGQALKIVPEGKLFLPVLAAVPALLLGMADDIRAFRPRTKLAFQFVVAAISMLALSGVPSDGYEIAFLLIGIMAGVVMMNAVNFLDVSDGYAAGICAASFFGLVLWWPSPVAAGLSGACLGFLLFNRPPAKIYMGDAGSHFLGLAGTNLIATAAQTQPWQGVALMASGCFAVALLELGLVTLIRWRKGISIWRGSPDHSALRLQAVGWGKGQALMIAAAVQMFLAGSSICLQNWGLR